MCEAGRRGRLNDYAIVQLAICRGFVSKIILPWSSSVVGLKPEFFESFKPRPPQAGVAIQLSRYPIAIFFISQGSL
jgi:hypothetical protein